MIRDVDAMSMRRLCKTFLFFVSFYSHCNAHSQIEREKQSPLGECLVSADSQEWSMQLINQK